MKSTSDHVSLPALAQKLKISCEKLLLAIDAQQMPVCIKMRPDIDSKLSQRHRSDKMDHLLITNPGLFPDAGLFPSTLPQHICVPLFTNYIDQMPADPAAPISARYVCKITDGKLVPYDLWPNHVHLTIANLVLLKEHAKQLIQKIKGGTADDELSKRERGSLLRTIGAMLDILLQTHAGGGTEDAVVMDIIATYPDYPGLSRSNLQKIFAESKIALECKERKSLALS